jgi:hypothetical protein
MYTIGIFNVLNDQGNQLLRKVLWRPRKKGKNKNLNYVEEK